MGDQIPGETSANYARELPTRPNNTSVISDEDTFLLRGNDSVHQDTNSLLHHILNPEYNMPGYTNRKPAPTGRWAPPGGTSEEEKRREFDKCRGEARTRATSGKYDQAIEMYSKALLLQPEDAECLVSRANCYLQLSDYKNALKDAESSLKVNAKQPKANYIKAESHFQRGEFEFALVCFHRAKRLRPGHTEFDRGVRKSEAAIEASLGEHAGAKLSLAGDLSFFEDQKAGNNPFYTETRDISSIGARTTELLARQSSAQMRTSRALREQRERDKAGKKDPKTIKQLLDELYGDWKYLDDLLNDEEQHLVRIDEEARAEETKRRRLIKEKRDALKGGNPLKQVEEDDDKLVPKDHYSEGSRRRRKQFTHDVRALTQRELRYLNERADFWLQQRAPRAPPKVKRRGQGSQADHYLKVIEDIEEELSRGRPESCLRRCERLKRDLQRPQTADRGRYEELLGTVQSLVGNAQYELGRYDKALDSHRADLSIAEKWNLDGGRSRALDNIGRTHAKRGEYAAAIRVFEQKIPLVSSRLETTWLYHELGRCYLETGNLSEAQACAEKSLESANQSDDRAWQLNASVLLAQAHVELEDYKEALDAFDRAYHIAELDEDKEAKSVISKAIADVNSRIAKIEKAKQTANKTDNSTSTNVSDPAENSESTQKSKSRENTASSKRSRSPDNTGLPERSRSPEKTSDNELDQEMSVEDASEDETPPHARTESASPGCRSTVISQSRDSYSSDDVTFYSDDE